MTKIIMKWLILVFIWQFFSIVLLFFLIQLAYFIIEKPTIFMSDFLYNCCFYTEKAPDTWFILMLYFLSILFVGYIIYKIIKKATKEKKK
jgi:H+/Cl- antiporter ClcA